MLRVRATATNTERHNQALSHKACRLLPLCDPSGRIVVVRPAVVGVQLLPGGLGGGGLCIAVSLRCLRLVGVCAGAAVRLLLVIAIAVLLPVSLVAGV